MSCSNKKPRFEQDRENTNLFDNLPEDLVIFILRKLITSASCPSDFVSILLTCTRMNRLGMLSEVLVEAGEKVFAMKAENWCESAHKFLKQCVKSGSVEACYFFGMILFYCLGKRQAGLSLMAKAAFKSHAPSLYSLAIIQFNGSGGSRDTKDVKAGVVLCARAAYVGYIHAIRELGYCLLDGYGTQRNATEGRALLLRASVREFLSSNNKHSLERGLDLSLTLSSDQEVHPVNKFLSDWFKLNSETMTDGTLICSYRRCGRPETRVREFRHCSVCGCVNYCSRGCQALDWRMGHKKKCVPRWPNEGHGHGGEGNGGDNGNNGGLMDEQVGLVENDGGLMGEQIGPVEDYGGLIGEQAGFMEGR